jgi:serine/threonine protein kinase
VPFADAILLEYHPLGAFTQHIGKDPEPLLAEKLNWTIQLAETLQFIHGHGIIHCDLEPSNLLS